jgi:DNA-binding Lrp family transcriptional regulator
MDFRSPLEALLPGVGAAVLSVLARTTQPLTIRQLAERAGASHPQVSNRVEHFERLGVVRREMVGRSHLVTLTASAASDLVRRLTFLDGESSPTSGGPLLTCSPRR